MTKADIYNYKNALVEVECVLNCLEHREYEKIPENVIKAIKNNKNKDYIFKYDKKLDYTDWNLMPETKALLYNIFKEYLATEEQKFYFKEKEKHELMKIEKEKIKKYNLNNVFKNTEKNGSMQNEISKQLINIPVEKWYNILFDKIKQIFMRK